MSPKDQDTAGQAAAGDATQAPGHDLPSAARRRAIFKGLSKSAALAGAAVPLQTLAGSGQRMRLKRTDGKFYQCTVSGNGSVLTSLAAGNPVQCGARPPAVYACKGKDDKSLVETTPAFWPNWPTKVIRGVSRAVCYGANNTAYLPTAKFSVVFGWGSSTDSIGACVTNTPNSDAAHWVTALLNATTAAPTFPYSPAEVIAFSTSNDANKKAQALTFFKEWLNRTPVA